MFEVNHYYIILVDGGELAVGIEVKNIEVLNNNI